MRIEEERTGIYCTVTKHPETIEEQLAAWDEGPTVEGDLDQMENGAWLVTIAEGYLLYRANASIPDSAPPVVRDARQVLIHGWATRQYCAEGNLDHALWNNTRAVSAYERMRVRHFEPVVIRGANEKRRQKKTADENRRKADETANIIRSEFLKLAADPAKRKWKRNAFAEYIHEQHPLGPDERQNGFSVTNILTKTEDLAVPSDQK